jgi:hypothetical protein
MVQFCPKCGIRDPDDEAVFCNRCGNRLHPHVPEKKENICPDCGTIIRDTQAVFCDKCGSPLHTIPPVPVRHAGVRPAAARPIMRTERCPACGALRVDEISDYCNICGAYLRRSAPPVTAGENIQPYPVKTGAAPPGAKIPDDGIDEMLPKKNRMPLLKWGLVAVVAVIVLIVAGASIAGMIPGTNQSANATPAPALHDQGSGTAVTTQRTTQAAAPARTPSPAKTTSTPVPTTVATTKASTTVTTNVSATVTANASRTVKPTLPIADASHPLSVGQSAYDGKGNLTVNDFSFKDKMSDPIPSYAIGKKYLIVNITYENLQQNETVDADLSRMMVKDAGGYPFEPASDALLENVYLGKSILPREKRTGNLLFIVPPEATYLSLYYTFGNQNSAVFQLT